MTNNLFSLLLCTGSGGTITEVVCLGLSVGHRDTPAFLGLHDPRSRIASLFLLLNTLGGELGAEIVRVQVRIPLSLRLLGDPECANRGHHELVLLLLVVLVADART